MNERTLLIAAFVALVACVLLACFVGWSYAWPPPGIDKSDFTVLR